MTQHFGHCSEFALITVDEDKITGKQVLVPPPHEPGGLPKWLHENGANVITGAPVMEPQELVKQYINASLVTGANQCDHYIHKKPSRLIADGAGIIMVETMDDKPLDPLQGHSLRYLEMAFRNDCSGRMNQPDGFGTKTGDCGDTVTFYLSVIREQIQSISYEVNGCLNTNACANAVIELTKGQTLYKAWEVSPEAVADLLESLPPDHFHCAELAVGAFYLALANCRELSRNGWKKGYLKH